jgi:hypothetical protein
VRSSALITGPMRALYQPPLASWLPDGAGTTEDMRQLHRATHRNEFAERAEFAWPNGGGFCAGPIDRPALRSMTYGITS